MNFFNKLIIFFSFGVITFIILSKKECIIAPSSHYNASFIEENYKDITGFGISTEDTENITNCGGAPTYGEITQDSAQALIDYLKPTAQDVFVDAGSGVGKLVVQFFFATPIKKAIGVELSQERFKKAIKVKESLAQKKLIAAGRILDFQKSRHFAIKH